MSNWPSLPTQQVDIYLLSLEEKAFAMTQTVLIPQQHFNSPAIALKLQENIMHDY